MKQKTKQFSLRPQNKQINLNDFEKIEYKNNHEPEKYSSTSKLNWDNTIRKTTYFIIETSSFMYGWAWL